MLITFITLITIAIPLQSLTYTRWARLGFISLLLSLCIATHSVTPLSLDSSLINMNTLPLYNGILNTTLVTNTVDVVLLLVATMLLTPYSHNNFNPKSVFAKTDLGNNTSIVAPVSFKNKDRQHQEPNKNEYILLTFCTLLGSIILIGANDLLTLLLGIELQSYSLYIIASTSKYPSSTGITEPSEAAGLKYYLLGALASALILLGIAILYGVTGSTSLPTITELMSYNSIESSAYLGIVLILIGIIWKFAGAPLHNWAVDVYDAVPTFSAAWLATIPKVALLTIMSEILLLVSSTVEKESTFSYLKYMTYFAKEDLAQNLNPIWLVLLVSALSMIIGAIGALTQPLIKRLLAYSSIGQLGFILLGISLGGMWQGTVIFYLAQYTITNAGLWLCLLVTPLFNSLKTSFMENNIQGDWRTDLIKNNFHNIKGKPIIPNLSISSEIRSITELQGIHVNNIYIALAYTILFFSLAGIPPMVGFFAKLEVISASLTSGKVGVVLSIIAVLSSLISAAYYLRVIRAIFFSKPVINLNLSSPSLQILGLPLLNEDRVSSKAVSGTSLVIFPKPVFTPKVAPDFGETNITYSSALIISIITLSVSLFILQGNVVLIWCKLMTM